MAAQGTPDGTRTCPVSCPASAMSTHIRRRRLAVGGRWFAGMEPTRPVLLHLRLASPRVSWRRLLQGLMMRSVCATRVTSSRGLVDAEHERVGPMRATWWRGPCASPGRRSSPLPAVTRRPSRVWPRDETARMGRRSVGRTESAGYSRQVDMGTLVEEAMTSSASACTRAASIRVHGLDLLRWQRYLLSTRLIE